MRSGSQGVSRLLTTFALAPALALAAAALAPLPARAAGPRCQFDAAHHTVWVHASRVLAGDPVRVRHHGHHRWHALAALPASGRAVLTTRRPVTQPSIDVRVGAVRCETT